MAVAASARSLGRRKPWSGPMRPWPTQQRRGCPRRQCPRSLPRARLLRRVFLRASARGPRHPGATPSPTVPVTAPTPQDKSKLTDEGARRHGPAERGLEAAQGAVLRQPARRRGTVACATIRGIIASLGDKHTAFLDPTRGWIQQANNKRTLRRHGQLVDPAEGQQHQAAAPVCRLTCRKGRPPGWRRDCEGRR